MDWSDRSLCGYLMLLGCPVNSWQVVASAEYKRLPAGIGGFS
jgi:hypothetical protein